MNADQLETLLARTLDDFRLSRGEKRALRATIDDAQIDDTVLADARRRAFELVRQRLAASDHDLLDWLEDAVRVLVPANGDSSATIAESYFSPGEECPQRLVSLIRHAKRSIDVCVFTITDNRLSSALREAKERGIRLRILTDNDKAEDRGSDIDDLIRSGISVRFDRTENHMHHKFAVFDREVLVTGSYNWTRSAALHNEENFIVTDEPRLVKVFLAEFQKLWDRLAD
ncbi:MAG: phospholipase D-like domain-containing protein [Planctomycetota bacterium]